MTHSCVTCYVIIIGRKNTFIYYVQLDFLEFENETRPEIRTKTFDDNKQQITITMMMMWMMVVIVVMVSGEGGGVKEGCSKCWVEKAEW